MFFTIFAADKYVFIMAKGNSWKHRNSTNADFGREPRHFLKRELRSKPQFSLDDLFITPFTKKKRFDEDGHWQYVPIARNMSPTGIHVMDDYLRSLSRPDFSIGAFAARHGLKTDEVNALVFILTGIKGTIFRQLYQARMTDELLRYTDLPFDEVARLSGHGSPSNCYLSLRRDCNMSPPERRRFLRQPGDLNRYAL